MPSVYFKREDKRAEVPLGTTILEAAREVGIEIEAPCGAKGTCGKCVVLVDGECVPSCHTEVRRDLTVTTVLRERNHTLEILRTGTELETALLPAVTKVYDSTKDRTEVCFEGNSVAFENRNTTSSIFGASVDIGTTTMVVSLLDLTTGAVLAEESGLNPQSLFAQDVLSRISYASEAGGLEALFKKITDAVNELISATAAAVDIDPHHIYEVVYSGNTCMLHLAANVSPESPGRYPYTPQISGGNDIAAADLGLAIAPSGRVVLPPILSAYVGADITSGILAVGLSDKQGTTLFVDIGTNGEMVIARDGKLVATSTAAGPAFEGMNIDCGMRASSGALESFEVLPDRSVALATIGHTPARGICGSGLVDIAGELVTWGVVNDRGRFIKDGATLPAELGKRLTKRNERAAFTLAGDVYLSQRDMRQIQLAKGAIRAGIECLLESVGVAAEEVDEVLIAGSFGYHLRAKNLLAIGLLPKAFEGKIRFVGNTSKTGGEALLRNVGLRQRLIDIAKDAEVIELANHDHFQSLFVKCMGF